jgi:hypothetical protein
MQLPVKAVLVSLSCLQKRCAEKFPFTCDNEYHIHFLHRYYRGVTLSAFVADVVKGPSSPMYTCGILGPTCQAWALKGYAVTETNSQSAHWQRHPGGLESLKLLALSVSVRYGTRTARCRNFAVANNASSENYAHVVCFSLVWLNCSKYKLFSLSYWATILLVW